MVPNEPTKPGALRGDIVETAADAYSAVRNPVDIVDVRLLGGVLLAGLAVFVVVSCIHLTSAISLTFYLAVLSLIWKVVLGWRNLGIGILVFLIYTVATIGLYLWQFTVNPEYFGFSGGLGVGSDDSFFYSLAVQSLPVEFPVREGYGLRSHNYSDILEVLANAIKALGMTAHPLDLLFFNVLGLTFVPFLTQKFARIATRDFKASVFSFWTSLFCPVLIANGLILIREGWMAACFVGSFYFALQRRFLMLFLVAVFALFLRLEMGALLVASVAGYMVLMKTEKSTEIGASEQVPRSSWAVTAVVLAMLGLLLGAGVLIDAQDMLATLSTLAYRQDFLESFIALSRAAEGGGTFFKINQLPWYFSVPFGFLFFIGSPFFSLNGLVSNGELIPRMVLANSFAVAFIAYIAYFVRGSFRALSTDNRAMLAIFVIFIVEVLVLSQASMQIRHKVALMPIFYVIAGYGFGYKDRSARMFGITASVLLLLVTIAINVLK